MGMKIKEILENEEKFIDVNLMWTYEDESYGLADASEIENIAVTLAQKTVKELIEEAKSKTDLKGFNDDEITVKVWFRKEEDIVRFILPTKFEVAAEVAKKSLQQLDKTLYDKYCSIKEKLLKRQQQLADKQEKILQKKLEEKEKVKIAEELKQLKNRIEELEKENTILKQIVRKLINYDVVEEKLEEIKERDQSELTREELIFLQDYVL